MDMAANNKKGSVLDARIARALNNNKIPSRDDIVHDLGDKGIEPVYFAIIFNFGDKRKTKHPEVAHHTNAMARRLAYGIDEETTEGSLYLIAVHEEGEGKGMNTFAGSVIVNSLMGKLFEEDYEIAAHIMTDYPTMMHKSINQYGPELLGKDAEDLTQEDILNAFVKFKSSGFNFKIGPETIKEEVCRSYLQRFSRFEQYLRGQKSLPRKDRRFIRQQLLKKYRSAVHQLREESVPKEKIKEQQNLYVPRMEELLSQPTPLSDSCTYEVDGKSVPLLQEGESAAYHASVERGYRELYLRRMFDWVLSDPDVSKFSALDLACAKFDEGGDNAGMNASKIQAEQHRLYFKGTALIEEGNRLFAEYNGGDSEALNRARSAHRLDQNQLLYRVIADYGQISLERDTFFRDHHIGWLEEQFGVIGSILGEEFIQQFGIDLVSNPYNLALTADTARIIKPHYDHLMQSAQYHGQVDTASPQKPSLKDRVTSIAASLSFL